MPVRKFRSIEAMDAATRSDRAGREGTNWEEVAFVLEMSDLGSPPRFPPGVYKHRTVADWNAQTDRWEAEAVARAADRANRIEEAQCSGPQVRGHLRSRGAPPAKAGD